MRDRMFVIPGGFVPYNDTVTLLTYKRLRNLDLDMDVFCFKGHEDKGLLEQLNTDKRFKNFNLKYTSNIDWAIPRNYPLRLPVGLFLMAKYVYDAVREFEKGDYKYLFSSIVPGISHVAAYHIKKKHPEVKWIASFSDPFKGSPYKNSDLSDKGLIYKLMFNVGSFCLYNDKYEELAVNNADKLIFICEEQRDFTLKQYPDYEKLMDKAVVYPLTYIPDWKMYSDLIGYKSKPNTVKQAVHLGRIYGLRRIDSFLEALRQLKNEDPDLSKKIVFHQYSEIQPRDLEKIKEYNIEDVLIVHDKVSYDESVQIMKDADVLVLFDTLMNNEPIQPYLPSKIVEYLMLRKPILAVCGQNSPSYRILKEYGHETIGYETKIIKQNIIKVMSSDMEFTYSIDKLNNDNYCGKLILD